MVHAPVALWNGASRTQGDVVLQATGIIRSLLVVALLVAAPLASQALTADAPAAAGGPVSGALCGGSAAPLLSPQPPVTPLLTIICGSCSESTCAGQNFGATCYNEGFSTCGVEPGIKCSDGHYMCTCEYNPQPLLGAKRVLGSEK